MLRGKRPDRKGYKLYDYIHRKSKNKKRKKKTGKANWSLKKSESSKKARVVTAGRGPGETSEGWNVLQPGLCHSSTGVLPSQTFIKLCGLYACLHMLYFPLKSLQKYSLFSTQVALCILLGFSLTKLRMKGSCILSFSEQSFNQNFSGAQLSV